MHEFAGHAWRSARIHTPRSRSRSSHNLTVACCRPRVPPLCVAAHVQEEEIESLAGKKEGCHDDVEFMTVQRSGALHASAPGALSSSQHLGALSASAVGLGHPAEVAAQWVEVPLGSVRVSLGYMSTWEDAHALVQFVASNYRDRSR